MKTRLLPLLLTLSLLVTLLAPCTVSAASSVEKTKIGNSSAYWEYDAKTAVLSITGKGEMPDFYNSGKQPWQSLYMDVKAIRVGSGITRIGDHAFDNLNTTTEVTLPDTLLSIGYCSFRSCSALEKLTLPASVKELGQNAFANMLALKSLTFPDKLTRIEGEVCKDCVSLEQVTISKNAKIIGWEAFSNCKKLDNLVIPDSVEEIQHDAFEKNISLQKITFGKNLKRIGYRAFFGCDRLDEIELPDSLTEIENNAFCECTSLSRVVIGKNVSTLGMSAFGYCPKLIEVCNRSALDLKPGSEDNSLVTEHAKNVYTPSASESKLKTKDGFVFYDSDDYTCLLRYDGTKTKLTTPNIGKNYEIYDYAFYKDDKITSLKISDKVTKVGEEALWFCRSLEELTFGKLTSVVYHCLTDCPVLTSITFLCPVVDFYNSWSQFPKTATIYGYAGSTAETTFGYRYSPYTFVSLGEPPKVEIPLGDINGDTVVNAMDCLILKGYILKTLRNATAEQIARMDLNGAGGINAMDYAVLRSIVLGKYNG